MFSILLPGFLVGAATFLAMLALLIVTFVFLLPGILLKLIPYVPLQRACSRYCVGVAIQWAATSQLIYRIFHPKQWQVDIRGKLDSNRSYLLVSNHQSMTDILLLFDVLHRRVPLPRFFLKQQLMYVPIIGMGCWAMDFPFMKRHSKAAVAANPALRHEDLEATRRSCEIFRTEPVTLVNFVEGTRFSEAKRLKNRSPYRYLLRPKSGGMSFALNAMGDQFAGLIDVTVAYRQTGKPLFWSWLCGEQDDLAIRADISAIPADLIHGDYEHDEEFRGRFQGWVNDLWTRKDARLGKMLDQPLSSPVKPAHHF
ncbi:acyltransferase [Stenotrophobium rhamnosiphilum]|uniref:Acyltransferase n=1 Tax=Stenotrophobium rhamnosiphilum TaxID=2029166 RepID=A0A2T5MFB7_9GAMM|nr:acyltransferase [Stenotrophobium rhamnosiphilum]PTU31256.1 acyltransferase [Stenotrophobium rhamnosiphilum]